MVATTPTYSLPYPTSSDPFDDALMDIPHALALQIESTITGLGGIASPGSWTAPSLASGWANLGSGYQGVQYRKVGQAVYIRGALLRSVSGYVAGTTIFTLPVGFRPPGHVVWAGDKNSGHMQTQVWSDGTVKAGTVAVGESLVLTSPAIWLD